MEMAPRRPTLMGVVDLDSMLGLLLPAGFSRLETRREAACAVLRIAARHKCGAWAVQYVTELAIVAMPRHRQHEPLVNAIDSLACYCVRREVAR